ncbi:MAG TPA: glycosyltransferase family 2 protein, partial [Candidatus Krumholzibacteria bacterium]|nr:glycosyltransferase family 2 protein [Candidatus Krumholzibacteria bacterium]
MHRDLKISVVIPCYNEEDGIRHTIGMLPPCVDEIVVVDNNSTDRTSEVAKSLGARVVFESRKGYGAAYKAGLPAVTGDVTVTLDGDGTYPAEQIPELVDHLVDAKLDFISASRFPLKNPRAMNFSNKVGNGVLTVGMALLYGKSVRDSQSGMWVYRSSVYPGLNVTSDGMPFSEEIKIEAIRRSGVRFGEYHIDYHPRVGEVKLQKWRDGFRNLFFLVKKR